MTSARIALVHTGGTIGSIGRDRLDLAWYLDTDETRSAEELLGALPELERIAEVRPVRYDTALSHALSPTGWLKLGTTVSALVDDPDVDGVVVTHGTNTLEESAYFLWLTTPPTKPVVVCGAMRPWSAVEAGARGIVSAGTGSGVPTPAEAAALPNDSHRRSSTSGWSLPSP
jgi:L-asparaginase